MTNNCRVSRGNVYCEARLAAARRSYDLNSREGASERLYISDRSLADYERGLTTPPPDVVMRMAEVYEAPELINHYCACECPAERAARAPGYGKRAAPAKPPAAERTIVQPEKVWRIP